MSATKEKKHNSTTQLSTEPNDKIRQDSSLEKLISNIKTLEDLEKRLSYTLREVDLCINRS